jgi:NADPH-dependent 2,4-dienoyl-CoA reductase/sulfur reductase-like enzyme/nitrite reductase/ring-hydroxylating ferredoxin subunit
MSGETELSGPDLSQGISRADLPDGGQVVGHTGGEPVLVVRRGEEIFAVGAACTHYGGPLGEGLVVGDTVRCPWHHACFSLRTGEAVRAPALNPVACYRVERRGETIVVRDKMEIPAKQRADGPGSVVIVGAGAAGNAAAETLRKEGYGGRIVIVGAEAEAPYDRPNLSKDYLAGTAPEEWIPLHPKDFYEERRIELLLGSPVTAIDPQKKTVTLGDGRTLAWGALVLATGAEPVRLPIPGFDLPHVHVLRSLADSRAIIAKAEGAKQVVVLGASFIGLEAAAALRQRRLPVTVAAPEDRPLSRVLGPDLGDFVRGLHEEKGVVFKLGTKPVEITATAVRLDNGESIEADLVVAGIGVRPRVALAEAAGLAVDNGVLVDEHLRASVEGIWAVGDIARWPDPHSGERLRVEHWVVAERQGQSAARDILAKARGGGERFAAVPFFWSQHYDVSINYVGHAAQWDAAEVEGSLAERSAVVRFRQGGKVAAVATVFRDKESLEAEVAMEEEGRA